MHLRTSSRAVEINLESLFSAIIDEATLFTMRQMAPNLARRQRRQAPFQIRADQVECCFAAHNADISIVARYKSNRAGPSDGQPEEGRYGMRAADKANEGEVCPLNA